MFLFVGILYFFGGDGIIMDSLSGLRGIFWLDLMFFSLNLLKLRSCYKKLCV
jgi:hypothetical protein